MSKIEERPHREESRRWLTQAQDNGLPGGVPSRYFDDPEEAEEAMELAKSVIDLVEKKITETEP